MNFIKGYTFVDMVFYSAISEMISLKHRIMQAEHIPSGLTLKRTRLDTE